MIKSAVGSPPTSVYRSTRNIRTIACFKKSNNTEVNATPGQGSAATLYRAYDPRRARQVALKVFRPDADDQLRPHFAREGKAHLTLTHAGAFQVSGVLFAPQPPARAKPAFGASPTEGYWKVQA